MGANDGDKIEGAGAVSDKASPSAREAGSFKRPEIKLPSDVEFQSVNRD